MSAPNRMSVVARGFVPGAALIQGQGRLWYRRGRARTRLDSAALRHFLAELGPSADYRVAPVEVSGRLALLLTWCREPIALYADFSPTTANAVRAFREYRGVPILITGRKFFVQERFAPCVTSEGYFCPVLRTCVRRRIGHRRFRFVVIPPSSTAAANIRASTLDP